MVSVADGFMVRVRVSFRAKYSFDPGLELVYEIDRGACDAGPMFCRTLYPWQSYESNSNNSGVLYD